MSRNRHDPDGHCAESPRKSERGLTFAELMVTLGVAAAMITLSMPLLLSAVTQQHGRAVAMEARSLVRLAYIKALKEKNEHRVVFNDENAIPANTIILQIDQGGSFATIPGEVYTAPKGVRILGSGPTDSMDRLDADSRGRCDPGDVYIRSQEGSLYTLSIDTQCHTSLQTDRQ